MNQTNAPKVEGDTISTLLITERSRKAALELLQAFDITRPRGYPSVKGIEQTVAIIIEQNMRGVHR